MIAAALGFLTSSAGKPVIIAIAILGALGYAYHKGYSAADLRCEAEALRSQLAAMEADVKNSKAAEADAMVRVAEITEKKEGLDAQLKRNKASRSNVQRCDAIGTDDADRLRLIQ